MNDKSNLTALGLTDSQHDAFAETGVSGATPVRITAEHRGMYRVHDGDSERAGVITGKMRFTAESPLDLPAVGDWAAAERSGDQLVIHALLPRRTLLVRKTSGRDADRQVIAANVDFVFVVQGVDAVNVQRMERYLAAVREGGARPVVLLTKRDLIGPDEIEQCAGAVREAAAGDDVHAVSALDDSGVETVNRYLDAGITGCFVGSSGVGKSTLINRVAGGELMRTAEVREGDRKGRHTTSHRQLIILPGGGMLIDTPGMREFGVVGDSGGIDESFPEIAALLGTCRFADCTHTVEPGCAILAAIEDGSLDRRRYDHYLKLQKEAAFNDAATVERARREKDRWISKIRKEYKEIVAFRKRNR